MVFVEVKGMICFGVDDSTTSPYSCQGTALMEGRLWVVGILTRVIVDLVREIRCSKSAILLQLTALITLHFALE